MTLPSLSLAFLMMFWRPLFRLIAQSVSRTFRQGDDLVIVLRTGGRIEIEGFFAVEDRVLVLRDPAGEDLLEARLDEDGALIGLEPRVLSDLAAIVWGNTAGG